MPTECNPVSMRFARLKGRDVVADFGGGTMTSDAGALLLGATGRASVVGQGVADPSGQVLEAQAPTASGRELRR